MPLLLRSRGPAVDAKTRNASTSSARAPEATCAIFDCSKELAETKFKKMIKDLVAKLMEEANEEAEHKGWCDTELSTSEQACKEKAQAVETLHAVL